MIMDVGTALARIESVNVGLPAAAIRPSELAAADGAPRTFLTAIAKVPVRGPVAVRATNLAGDAQADTKHHGGPDKAVHAHFVVHLTWWGARRGSPVSPGEIGENLTLGAPVGGRQPEEADFCIGDVLTAGGAVLQVTQPRIPCYKQAAALHIAHAVQIAGESGRTGIYLRVVREGTVQAGDDLVLLERPNPGVTLADANRFVHHARRDPVLRSRLEACAGLGSELRRLLAAPSED